MADTRVHLPHGTPRGCDVGRLLTRAKDRFSHSHSYSLTVHSDGSKILSADCPIFAPSAAMSLTVDMSGIESDSSARGPKWRHFLHTGGVRTTSEHLDNERSIRFQRVSQHSHTAAVSHSERARCVRWHCGRTQGHLRLRTRLFPAGPMLDWFSSGYRYPVSRATKADLHEVAFSS